MVGSAFLLYRTLTMILEGALQYLTLWVSVMLIIEMLIDLACLLASAWWFRINDKTRDRLPLRLGTAVALFHALRVLVFAMGRVGPWIDFDVRPEHRALHHETWSWTEVYFASIMSVLGIAGVIVIWRIRIRNRKALK
jgi:hypothetical protein